MAVADGPVQHGEVASSVTHRHPFPAPNTNLGRVHLRHAEWSPPRQRPSARGRPVLSRSVKRGSGDPMLIESTQAREGTHMNTTTLDRSTITRTVAALATVAVTLILATAGPASARTGGHHRQDVCRLAPQYLPRTADAVEGWLRHCSR